MGQVALISRNSLFFDVLMSKRYATSVMYHPNCYKCGVELNSTYRFCPSCGTTLAFATNLSSNLVSLVGDSIELIEFQNNNPKSVNYLNNRVIKVITFFTIGLSLIVLSTMVFKDSEASNVEINTDTYNQENETDTYNQENENSVEIENERLNREYERCYDRLYMSMMIKGAGDAVADSYAKRFC